MSTYADQGANASAARALEVKQVTKYFGNVHAVDGVSLEIPTGQVVALLGENGAGKTTLLDMVLGLNQPTSGTIKVLGTSVKDAAKNAKISAVLQTSALLGDVDVQSNIEMIATLNHLGRREVMQVMDRVNLTELRKRKVVKLSGGERQRVKLAIALVAAPQLLILDEPTTGMDPLSRKDFWDTMRAQTSTGRTLIFATHFLQEAADFADRIIIMNHGKIVADGSLADLQAMASDNVVTITWPGTLEQAQQALSSYSEAISALELTGAVLNVHTKASDSVARTLLDQRGAKDLRISASTLDDVFAALIA